MKMPNRDIANQLNYAYFTLSNNPQIVKTNFNKLLSMRYFSFFDMQITHMT